MDLNSLSNMISGGAPDISGLMGSLKKPEYEQSKEYGAHRNNGEFNALADYELPSLDIDTLTVRSGAIVDAIIVTYSDGSTVQHGGNGGGVCKISLKGDSIKRITGYSGVNFGGRGTISQLRIETANGKKYGPFGSGSGSAFEISKDGNKIVAFFGSADGGYLTSLGAYLMKL